MSFAAPPSLTLPHKGGGDVRMRGEGQHPSFVMPGRSAGHPRLRLQHSQSWMAGTSPAMTKRKE